MLVARTPGPRRLLGWHPPRVARLRTPEMPPPPVDPAALTAVEDRYVIESFTPLPLIEPELANARRAATRADAVTPAHRRRVPTR